MVFHVKNIRYGGFVMNAPEEIRVFELSKEFDRDTRNRFLVSVVCVDEDYDIIVSSSEELRRILRGYLEAAEYEVVLDELGISHAEPS